MNCEVSMWPTPDMIKASQKVDQHDSLWRPRADSSASTALCSSSAISSCPATPQLLPSPDSDFDIVFIPLADEPCEGVQMVPQASLSNSPVHKARRVQESVNCMEAAMLTIRSVQDPMAGVSQSDDTFAPSTPQTPRDVRQCSAVRAETPPRLARRQTNCMPTMDTPCTPRQSSPLAAFESPRSTRKVSQPETPPDLVPSWKTQPPLLRALEMKSAKEVKAVLALHPDAANELFWDVRGVDHPLCCAIRHKCSAEIIKLLIENGAELDVTGKEGRTPSQLLSTMCPPDPPMVWQQFSTNYEPALPPWKGGQFAYAPLVDQSAWQQGIRALLAAA